MKRSFLGRVFKKYSVNRISEITGYSQEIVRRCKTKQLKSHVTCENQKYFPTQKVAEMNITSTMKKYMALVKEILS